MDILDFSKFHIPDLPPEEAQRRATQLRVDTYNRETQADDGTGIVCDTCHGKGLVAFVSPETGNFTTRPCKCHGTRLTVGRLQRAGLWERAKRCRLEQYQVETPTQRALRDTTLAFLQDPKDHWLLLCGQSGTGKTHLCVAAFVQLSYRLGLAGEYFRWNADGRALKSATLEDPGDLWQRYKDTELLYIDDLFKGGTPSGADLRLAFELLNHRYDNRLMTIISSEWQFDQLLQLDEAIAGRIQERCGRFLVNVGADQGKNFRLMGCGA
jgi:DNA replication protein DnaC